MYHVTGHNVCLVSSGAVGVGCQVLQLKAKPGVLAQRQALAAVGQGHLMRYYSEFFNTLSLVRPSMQCLCAGSWHAWRGTWFPRKPCLIAALLCACADERAMHVQKSAQVLLTSENLASEVQYKNAQNTFAALFDYGVIPVVNENVCALNPTTIVTCCILPLTLVALAMPGTCCCVRKCSAQEAGICITNTHVLHAERERAGAGHSRCRGAALWRQRHAVSSSGQPRQCRLAHPAH